MGTCCPSLSSLSMCSSVVFPALSSPRNTSFPDFLYSPRTKKDLVNNQLNQWEFISSTRYDFTPRNKVQSCTKYTPAKLHHALYQCPLSTFCLYKLHSHLLMYSLHYVYHVQLTGRSVGERHATGVKPSLL